MKTASQSAIKTRTAFILAAGLGTRLKPITETLPKALVPVAEKPLLAWHLERLEAAGFERVVINASYLREQLIDFVSRYQTGSRMDIALSLEETPLETGGAMVRAMPLLGDSPVLVVNADVWSELSPAALASELQQAEAQLLEVAEAVLWLVDNPPHNPSGDFVVHRADAARIDRFAKDPVKKTGYALSGGEQTQTFSGFSLLNPGAICACADGREVFALRDYFAAALARGTLGCLRFPAIWFDVGTKERLAACDEAARRFCSPD